MNQPKECPFCGQRISPEQYARLRERIRKAEDPGLLRELDVLRQDMASTVRESLEAEYAPVRKQLEAYKQREKQLNELRTELDLDRKDIDAEVVKRLAQREKDLIETATQRATSQFEGTNRQKDERIKSLVGQMQELQAQMEDRVAQELQSKESALREDERKRVESKYGPLSQRLREYENRELQMEKREQALALKEGGVELEVQKRLSAEREALVEQAANQVAEQYSVEGKQKDQTIEGLKREMARLQERLQFGSPQERGYVQQAELAQSLQDMYATDLVQEIRRGVHGADVIQQVRPAPGVIAGSILWESKRTKDYHHSWIQKLREDQREQKADFAVLVSAVLPEEVEHFSTQEGVVIARLGLVGPLSSLLRQSLITLARQRLTAEQRESKMQELYGYMTGKEFQQRVSGVVEATMNLQESLDREMRAHQRMWAERRKIHERALRQTALLYGEVAGIVGTLPAVASLELPGSTGEADQLAGPALGAGEGADTPPDLEGEGGPQSPEDSEEDIPF